MAKRNASRKIKVVKAPTLDELAAITGLTPERFRRDEFTRDKPVVRDGKLSHPHSRVSRAVRWQRDNWVDATEAACLVLYENIFETCNYGGARSCIDPARMIRVDGGGNGQGITPNAVANARADLARVRNYVHAVAPPIVLMVTHELLTSPECPEDASVGMVHGETWEARKIEVRRMIKACAGAMVGHFGVRMAA